MAILHRATLTPSKPELLAAWLDRQPWGSSGEMSIIGTYRYDDPAGEVGIEGFVVRRGGAVLHAVLTYRPAPLDGGEAYLAGTVDHSLLGQRWVYDASGDPVALACLEAALRGDLPQAALEVYDDGTLVEVRPWTVTVTSQGSPTEGSVRIVNVIGSDDFGDSRTLLATWEGGSGVVAGLVR